MSILLRLKNKLQDLPAYETKMREFDECMSLLRNENAELHKRIDQLESLCKTHVSTQQTRLLDEHIRELEQENGKLFAENQCQRQEYVQFLDQLSAMVVRTAIMQENIRKECASIYHVIEKLSSLTTNAIQINHASDIPIKDKLQSICGQYLQKPLQIENQLYHSASTSLSSSLTQCSVSTSDSWTHDTTTTKTLHRTTNKCTDQQVIQRSETFLVAKPAVSLPITVQKDNVDHCPIARTMVLAATPVRPSRLPCRRPDSKLPPSTTSTATNRSLSTPKVSRLPVRTASSLNREQTPTKKSSIPTLVTAKTKRDTTGLPNRTTGTASSAIGKKASRPSAIVQSLTSKLPSSSPTNNTHMPVPASLSQCARPAMNIIKSHDHDQQMNSTSSESSIEEQQAQMQKLLPILQDEGYSTWSSMDVKDDVTKPQSDDREKNIGLVKTWLNDTATNQCPQRPVNDVENDKLQEFSKELSDGSLFLCPFVRNRCSNVVPILVTSTPLSSSNKDISLDSLESASSKHDSTLFPSSSSSSSSIFSCSEIFEKVLLTQTLSHVSDDVADTTSSASSTFNMSEYIEDHFIDQDDNISETPSSMDTTVFDRSCSSKPQKRLLLPGVLNRLIFFRRICSDSDLQRRDVSLHGNENQAHVYHSNIINEHSVEVHLINTYGSDTELQVWSHDCAEQRRFLDEREQYQQPQVDHNLPDGQQLAAERQRLLQEIFDYPWLRQDNDLERPTNISLANIKPSVTSPSADLIVPSPNPDFYQLCALTNSSSLVLSPDQHIRHITAPPIL